MLLPSNSKFVRCCRAASCWSSPFPNAQAVLALPGTGQLTPVRLGKETTKQLAWSCSPN